ncbi:ABC transporter ATP-binding protein (plasmid) [Mesomycoplasma conjunctivae]|nr:ABC transporter ATP-binding protein [Mesomycoplasma conjunctivae]
MKTYKIEFKNVTLAYQNEVVLSNLNIIFESGKTYGIYGLSGVGKSTLIKAILEPKLIAKGQILINDQDINKIDQKTYKTVKKDISFLFQEPSLIETDDVIENIKRKSNNIYNNWFYKVFRILTKEQKNKLAKILEYLDIFDYINTPVKDLSGGQKQRVELASIFLKIKILFWLMNQQVI